MEGTLSDEAKQDHSAGAVGAGIHMDCRFAVGHGHPQPGRLLLLWAGGAGLRFGGGLCRAGIDQSDHRGHRGNGGRGRGRVFVRDPSGGIARISDGAFSKPGQRGAGKRGAADPGAGGALDAVSVRHDAHPQRGLSGAGVHAAVLAADPRPGRFAGSGVHAAVAGGRGGAVRGAGEWARQLSEGASAHGADRGYPGHGAAAR